MKKFSIGLMVCVQLICAHNDEYKIDPVVYPMLAKVVTEFSGVIEPTQRVYNKGDDFRRVFNAAAIKKVISKNDLDCLDVAKKYISCTGPGNCQVLAQEVQGHSPIQLLSVREVEQLVTLVFETGFQDWDFNVIRDKYSKKLVFIDTEDASFSAFIPDSMMIQGQILPSSSKAAHVFTLRNSLHELMEPEAQIWMQKKIDELLKSPEGLTEVTAIFLNKKNDDHSIDFSQFKAEFKVFQQDEPIKHLAQMGLCNNCSVTIKSWSYGTIEQSQKVRDAIMQAKSKGKHIVLRGFTCRSLNLSNMDLSGIDFSNSKMDWADISGSNIAGANFSNAYLYKMKMNNVQGLNTAVFAGAQCIDDLEVDDSMIRSQLALKAKNVTNQHY